MWCFDKTPTIPFLKDFQPHSVMQPALERAAQASSEPVFIVCVSSHSLLELLTGWLERSDYVAEDALRLTARIPVRESMTLVVIAYPTDIPAVKIETETLYLVWQDIFSSDPPKSE
jgi:hypothetical protein